MQLCDLLESVGRAVTDLGFSGLVEKFEQHVGVLPTKVLLIAIGGATFATCINAMFTLAVFPMYGWVASLLSASTAGALKPVINAAGAFTGGITGIIGAYYVMLPWIRRRSDALTHEARDYLAKAKKEREDIMEQIDALKAELSQIKND